MQSGAFQRIQRRKMDQWRTGHRSHARAGIAFASFRVHSGSPVELAEKMIRRFRSIPGIIGGKSVILRIVQTDTQWGCTGKSLRHLSANTDPERRIASMAGMIKVPPDPTVLLHLAGIA